MVSENVTTLLWMLIFFLVFYLYIDIRMTKLRKEMLGHYMLCENMITKQIGAQNTEESPLRLGSSVYEPVDGLTNIIPTREETAYGFSSLNNLKCSAKGCDGTEWLSSSPIGSGFTPGGLLGYDITAETGNYATFTT